MKTEVRGKCASPSAHLSESLCPVMSSRIATEALSLKKITWFYARFQPKVGAMGKRLVGQKKQWTEANVSQVHHCGANARHFAMSGHPGSEV